MDKQALMNGTPISSLVGTPIYGLDNGLCLGKVKNVVYDSVNHKLMAFTLEEPGYFSAHRRVLMFSDVKSIGRDAITVASKDVLQRDDRTSDVTRAIRRGEAIQGKTILTESGNELGHVAETLLNPDTGEAVSYVVSRGMAADVSGGRNYVSATRTLRIGHDAIVVPDNVEATFEEQAPGGIAGAYLAAKDKAGEYGRNVAQLSDQQKTAMAKGKTAGYDVRDDQGMLIVAQGEVITDTIIEIAQQKGKLSDLAMSAAAGSASGGYERAKTFAGTTAGTAGAGWEATKAGLSNAWANFMDSLYKSMDLSSRRRAVAEQKRFLVARTSDSDIRDDKGNLIIKSGELITPLALDTLDRLGKLEQLKIKPLDATVVERVEPQFHVVVESPEKKKREQARPHI